MSRSPDSPPAPQESEPPLRPSGLDDSTLNDLVAEALDLADREGESALAAFFARHPAEAEALRSRFEMLRAFGFSGGEVPERLGGFRLLRKLGGGGMGVVYVAEQEGLGRRVALKLVRPELLYFPGARERFRRELDALARLQHPGIVPIFDGGTENGVPYLAMEYVRGSTLEEALQSLAHQSPVQLSGRHLHAAVEAIAARRRESDDPDGPETALARKSGSSSSAAAGLPALYAGSWVATCVRIALAVAEALQHAHEQGVLHRDLKPSNLMLTPNGRVLLLDFGLASAAGSAKLTGTGQAIGSPLYMSPEQMRGEVSSIDQRSDIYGLGLTLFEALTLHQPFAAQGFEETRLKVLSSSPPVPRALNPNVPRDAETVVLVAMDRDPHRRYESAAAFAEDLRCVLELRPIHARRPGSSVRAQRWIQRHPARAVAIACGALLLVGGPLVFGWQQHVANRQIGAALVEAQHQRDAAERSTAEAKLQRDAAELNFGRAERAAGEAKLQRDAAESNFARAERSAAEAERQRDVAEKNFDRAERSIEVLLTQVAEEDLLDVPHLEGVRRRLLESALAFYEELLEERAADERLLASVAEAAFRKGFVLQQLGRYEEALAAHRRQLELAEQLVRTRGRDHATLQQLGWATGGIAACTSFLGRNDEAREMIERSIDLLNERRRAFPSDPTVIFDLDEAMGRRAHIAQFSEDVETAHEAYRELVELDLEVLANAHEPSRHGQVVCNALIALSNFGTSSLQLERLEDASFAAEQGQRILEAEEGQILEISSGPHAVAAFLAMRSDLHLQRGEIPEAEALLRNALARLVAARTKRPYDFELLRSLATSWNNLALLLTRRGAPTEDIVEAYDASVLVGREIERAAPYVPLYVGNLARTLMNYGTLLREREDPAAARAPYEEAWQLALEMHRLAPEQGEERRLRTYIAWHLSLACLDDRDPESAAQAARLVATTADGENAHPFVIAAGLQARVAKATEDPARREVLRRETLQWMRDAAAAGYADLAELDRESDLAALRADPEFPALRALVAENAERAARR